MNTPKFKPRDFTETLLLLCKAKGGKLLRGGNVNLSEVARLSGTAQPNLYRWTTKEHTPTDENIARIAKAFKVTPAQMRGEMPIDCVDGFSSPNPEDLLFIEEYQRLPEDAKNLVREQIRLLSKLSQTQQ